MFGCFQNDAAGVGDRDDLGTTVLGVRLANDETIPLEAIDRFGDGARREVQRAGYIRRTTGAELAQEEQELASRQRNAFRRHRLVHQPVDAVIKLKQPVGNFECLLHDHRWKIMRCHVKWQQHY
ncbi:hypothetical protein D3C87_1695420 [compost metagenome]